MIRLPLGPDLDQWWTDEVTSHATISLWWRADCTVTLGELIPDPPMLNYAPDFSSLTDQPHLEAALSTKRAESRLSWLAAKALTRAGWMRPRIDPEGWARLLALSRSGSRSEFILDTNAMVAGVGHYLASVFADACDLVTTPVTLREIQDAHGIAKFSAPMSELQKRDTEKALKARHRYLAASRFREFCGSSRPVWRDLEVDDTALLLSRGLQSGDKVSEADTLMLRAVRRSVADRVNGLERFFVTGDIALARRAATELPGGSLIAARTPDLIEGKVYTPSVWWPGPDQGFAVLSRSTARLCWELLALADAIELRTLDAAYRLSAFESEMWPSDYTNPWIRIETHPTIAARSPSTRGPEQEQHLLRAVVASTAEPIGVNLRFSAENVLDVLANLSTSELDQISLPSSLLQVATDTYEYLRRFFGGLQILDLDEDRRTARPLSLAAAARMAWVTKDLDQLAALLLPYDAFAEAINSPERLEKRPQRTVQGAKRLATLLGQVVELDGRSYAGHRNPSLASVRTALTTQFDKSRDGVILIHDFFVEVLLKRLGVSPVRAAKAWDTMEAFGVFSSVELRTGGTSPKTRTVPRLELQLGKWEIDRLDLDDFRGYRDLRRHHA